MRTIDLDKQKAISGCLNWTATDVAYKVSCLVDMASDVQEDYEIIDEHTEEHREYLQGLMQDSIEENYETICDKINECLWDYIIENKTEIIQTLIENKYLKLK